ncbi:DNA helicase [Encephalitozoon hellem ATCC 50504]|uniref:RuvB-like helicase n=1 Tax=Encephalitozoon hellem TaxID=27973 RepID=A0A9Q9C887_ENCHE|nr:DNA helicase [Encephalitozoon hellem ATCC 50504]AFM99389.1 DNA helicase [Encephalitozoon hellem ATCC 50504]UTX44397.1 RuvB-like helicase 2 [Encephalitozoon hellem]WEL39898.1 TIP49 P-loop domain-containing protein [Encephalitozoon hellem]|eukprot:XP_003888370.1 DNA helicase [Encephalitozoon hellem ATCC 50504]
MQVRDVETVSRIGLHSHVCGLGLNGEEIEYDKDGLVGQMKARKAMMLIKKMVESNKGGKIVLIKGERGSGKTALAIGLSKSLGGVHFNSISGTEIYSLEMSKSEAITQALRKSVGLRIKESVKVIEGEVVSLNGRRIVLKTVDMESSFDIGEKMRNELDREKVSSGDIIRIVKERGKVYKIGTSMVKKTEVVGTDTRFVPCPEGELIKIVEEVQEISLHDIDVVNNKAEGYLALFSGETGEIRAETRDEVNKKIWNWINEGKAEVVRGVLFIDEVHMLDIESFAFLNKAIEEDFCPVILISTNKKECVVRGTDETGLYGMPRDFIDRTLIISMEKYCREDLEAIIKHRILEEDILIDSEAMDRLVSISETSGLRYSMNLLTISSLRASRRGGKVTIEDIQRVFELFLDEARGVENLEVE